MNSPIPQDVTSECRKCARIIEQFIKPDKKGIDQIIPPYVIAWSAPSGIGTAGFGAGGQIGVELTDFVIILNTKESVKAFSMGGNVTLGGNLSVAAGPIGRNAEAAGAIGALAAIYSYSKTRGLFVGVSIEGSVIVERKETNAAFYRRKISAKEILSGAVPPPPAAEELYRALNRRTNMEMGDGYDEDEGVYRTPTYSSTASRQWPAEQPSGSTSPRSSRLGGGGGYSGFDSKPSGYQPSTGSGFSSSARSPPPPPPRAGGGDRVVALFDFTGERDGDLSFRKGDSITVVQRNANEWWLGRVGGREGVFPANY
ncbi:hypothetical protein HK405_010936, partial [Cladochytrium tenue]